jgi:hypothetical protein
MKKKKEENRSVRSYNGNDTPAHGSLTETTSDRHLKQRSHSHLHHRPYDSPIVVRTQQSLKQLSLDDDVLPTPDFPGALVMTYALRFIVVGEMRRRVISVVQLLGCPLVSIC